MVHPLDQPIRPLRRRRRSSDAPTPEATPVPVRAAVAGTEGPTSSDGGRRARETFAAHLFRRATMEATTMEGAGDADALSAGVASMLLRDDRDDGGAGRRANPPSRHDVEWKWSLEPGHLASSEAPPSTTRPRGSFEEQLEQLNANRHARNKSRQNESGRSKTSAQSSSSSGSASSVQSAWAEREGVRRRQSGPNPFAFF